LTPIICQQTIIIIIATVVARVQHSKRVGLRCEVPPPPPPPDTDNSFEFRNAIYHWRLANKTMAPAFVGCLGPIHLFDARSPPGLFHGAAAVAARPAAHAHCTQETDVMATSGAPEFRLIMFRRRSGAI
jgi:hypothetical protein